MVAGGEDANNFMRGKDGGDGIKAAGEGLADDEDVGGYVFMLVGEELAGSAEAGLDLVGHEEDVMLAADLGGLGEEAGGRDEDAGFALMGSTRKAQVLGVMAARRAAASPNGMMRKPGRKGPKPS